MKFILGQKQEMTQIFKEDSGDVIPVTRVSAGPCPIIRIKEQDSSDGYHAAVIGLTGKKKMGKRDLGQTKGLGNLQYIKEFRLVDPLEAKIGDLIKVDTFGVGDKVKVVGISKGKGFQGVVKRHGFHGQQATHGTKDQERAPGSIGPTEPARVFPGMRMPGHMGSQQVTVKNLEIIKIDIDKNELFIKGAIPGARHGLLMLSATGDLKLTQSEAPKEEVVKKSEKSEESKAKSAVKEENQEEKSTVEKKETTPEKPATKTETKS